MMRGRVSPQGDAQSKRQRKGNRAEQQGAGEGLSDNFRDGSPAKLQRVPQVSAEHPGSISEKLLGKGSGKAVFCLQNGLGAGIQRPLGGERRAGSDADE